MAYDPDNPPSLVTQAIGGPTGLRWFALMWTDPIVDVIAPGYISNAAEIGMRAGDGLIYKDTNRGEWDHYDLICLEINADGSADLAFPEVPEEALTEEVMADPALAYIAGYQGGRQVRFAADDLGAVIAPIASQAEAEAGTENTKRMTPLRTFQSIAAYITGRATKTPPVDADAILITDSAASGAPKRVTWANIKAAMFTAWGALLVAATAKTTPVDADNLLLADSAASDATKKVTWANLKAAIRTYMLGTASTWSAIQTFSAIPSITAGGILFPATQVPSANANALDDYKESTLTVQPAFGGAFVGMGGTFAGRSIKVGKMVTVIIAVAFSSKGSSTGTLAIGTVPLAAADAVGSVSKIGNAASLVAGMTCHINAGQDAIFLDAPITTGTVAVTDANINPTTTFVLTITYEAAN